MTNLGDLLRAKLAKLSELNVVRINEKGFDILVKCMEDTLREYFKVQDDETGKINQSVEYTWNHKRKDMSG